MTSQKENYKYKSLTKVVISVIFLLKNIIYNNISTVNGTNSNSIIILDCI